MWSLSREEMIKADQGFSLRQTSPFVFVVTLYGSSVEERVGLSFAHSLANAIRFIGHSKIVSITPIVEKGETREVVVITNANDFLR